MNKVNSKSFLPALLIAGGYLAANVAEKQLEKIPSLNTTLVKTGAKVGLGVLLASSKNGTSKSIGTGMIVNAIAGFIGTSVPSLGSGNPKPFALNSGVQGMDNMRQVYYSKEAMPRGVTFE